MEFLYSNDYLYVYWLHLGGAFIFLVIIGTAAYVFLVITFLSASVAGQEYDCHFVISTIKVAHITNLVTMKINSLDITAW